ncbi:MAG: hypothetical protein HY291_00745 [Planctomycetes bacterium]|nr:hypothetical protein [Planctomycetota bacterium]
MKDILQTARTSPLAYGLLGMEEAAANIPAEETKEDAPIREKSIAEIDIAIGNLLLTMEEQDLATVKACLVAAPGHERFFIEKETPGNRAGEENTST